MKRFLTIAAVVALSLWQADQSVAQKAGRPTDAVEQVSDVARTNAARVTRDFARCYARPRARIVSELLSLPYGGDEQNQQTRRLLEGQQRCMGNNGVMLGFNPILIVGSFAEYLITTSHSDFDLSSITALSDEAVVEAGLRPRNSYETVSLCIIRRDAGGVRSLIDTEPRSSEEAAIFERLLPHFSPCIPAGSTITFSRSVLRSMMAAALYRAMLGVAANRRSAVGVTG